MSLLCRMQDFALALPLLNPKLSLGCYSTNEATSLSPISSLLCYNVTPLRPQSGKTSVPKIKSIIIKLKTVRVRDKKLSALSALFA